MRYGETTRNVFSKKNSRERKVLYFECTIKMYLNKYMYLQYENNSTISEMEAGKKKKLEKNYSFRLL